MPREIAEPAPAAVGAAPRLLLSPWLPVLLGAVCFANSLQNGLTYDDLPLIHDNPRIRALTNVRAIWLSDWWYPVEGAPEEADPQRDRLYRPLTLFTFALNYAAHGLRPFGFHLANVLLHAATCGLVWHFARRLTGDAAVAAVAAVLFAVHPIHAEAVANVVGRAELLAALFMLTGLLVLMPRPRAPGATGAPGLGRALLTAPTFLAALLSKETAVCYPGIALLTLYALHRRQPLPRRTWLMHAGCLVLPLLVYFPIRYVALEHHLLRAVPVGELLNPLTAATPWQRVLGAFTILGHYTRLLGVPDRLSCDYGLAIIDPMRGFTGMTLLGLLAAGGLIVLLGGFVRRGPLGRQLALLTAMALASYVLISNTFLLIGVSLAERLMYWPSVPVLILAATGLVAFWRRHCGAGGRLADAARVLRVLGLAVVAALGLRTVVRNMDWASNRILFLTDVTTHPGDAHLNRCYGYTLLQMSEHGATPDEARAQREAARWHFDRALRAYPGFADALQLRGQTRALMGDTAGARLDLENAIQLQPKHRGARQALAELRAREQGGDVEQRLAALEQRVREHAADPALRLEYGSALLESGRDAAALAQLREAVKLDPRNAVALRRLGEVLAILQKNDEAKEMFERVLQLDPNDWQAHTNLVQLVVPHDPAAALQHAQRAYELQPNDVRTWLNLAGAYAADGQTATALEFYGKIERGLEEGSALRRFINERIEVLRRRQRQ